MPQLANTPTARFFMAAGVIFVLLRMIVRIVIAVVRTPFGAIALVVLGIGLVAYLFGHWRPSAEPNT
jgi:hypothetical protein